ncbi:hypothetical protein THAOC_19600 [Thalassiosira oceanica]|uniref:Uncharacterized protein n=1 Tax=Thalassiosira oceanica TaxID=159749 RepID=K0S4A0_THAOC|nr:hypothetical protein THAOC_19600 [Thalassiosira oceanica]|eukprot:EJK60110.1 hypothetical protein THAOC_19600 [Thalassiosira oceanica]
MNAVTRPIRSRGGGSYRRPLSSPAGPKGASARRGVGGLRNLRHDELGRTFATHAKDALSKAYVRRKPRVIRSGEQRQDRNSNAAGSNATSPPTPRREDQRVATCQSTASGLQVPHLFLTSASLIPRPNPIGRKTLERFLKPKKERKDKYLRKCLERRKHFTPLVFSVDGTAGREAKKAMKHLASMLAKKWERPHGQVAHFVKTSMAI